MDFYLSIPINCSNCVARTTVRYEIPIMIGFTFLLLAFGVTDGNIVLFEGILFLICFAGYLLYMFVMVKKGLMQSEEVKTQDKPIWQMLLISIIGLAAIVFGSDLTVDSATAIAQMLGMSEKFIGLTIVALGTSLPELFTSVIAARKGKADIAIGNIVGSNIFNVLFVLGTSALIHPVPFEISFVIDCLVAALAGAVLWLCVFRKKKLVRIHGIIMLLCYVAYFIYLLMK